MTINIEETANGCHNFLCFYHSNSVHLHTHTHKNKVHIYIYNETVTMIKGSTPFFQDAFFHCWTMRQNVHGRIIVITPQHGTTITEFNSLLVIFIQLNRFLREEYNNTMHNHSYSHSFRKIWSHTLFDMHDIWILKTLL